LPPWRICLRRLDRPPLSRAGSAPTRCAGSLGASFHRHGRLLPGAPRQGRYGPQLPFRPAVPRHPVSPFFIVESRQDAESPRGARRALIRCPRHHAGTTVGMLLVNVPVVAVRLCISKRLPSRSCTRVARSCFLVLGRRRLRHAVCPLSAPAAFARPIAAGFAPSPGLSRARPSSLAFADGTTTPTCAARPDKPAPVHPSTFSPHGSSFSRVAASSRRAVSSSPHRVTYSCTISPSLPRPPSSRDLPLTDEPQGSPTLASMPDLSPPRKNSERTALRCASSSSEKRAGALPVHGEIDGREPAHRARSTGST